MRKLISILTVVFASTVLTAQSGEPDTTFNGNGFVVDDFANQGSSADRVIIQSDGKILVAGTAEFGGTSNMAVARYNNDGSPDSTFGANGKINFSAGFIMSFAFDIAVQNDGKIVLGGYRWDNSTGDFVLARLNQDGSLDNSFGTGISILDNGLAEIGKSIYLLEDGKIIISGDSNDQFTMAKVNQDGNIDSDFGIRGKFTDDGKILIGGHSYFGTNPLRYEIAIARLNADGSIDNTYGNNGFSKFRWTDNGENYLNDMVFQNDGKLLISGRNSDSSGDYFSIARLNTDGQLDTTFGNEGKISGNVDLTADTATSIAVQPDGKIVIAGNTADFTNPTKYFVARFLNETMAVSDTNLSEIKVYPNPVKGLLNLDLKGNAIVEIYTMTGQKITTLNIQNKGQIDVSSFANGVYMLKINIDGKVKTQKFIKK